MEEVSHTFENLRVTEHQNNGMSVRIEVIHDGIAATQTLDREPTGDWFVTVAIAAWITNAEAVQRTERNVSSVKG
jgi:hypothetical protein